MEEPVSSIQSGHELLILHTAEAQEWATYLQQILKSSKKFRKRSILLYTVGPADQLHGYNFDNFHSSKCIVVLLTTAFLDMLYEPELHGAMHRLLYPPHRVVVLLCGISEDDVPREIFEDWQSWRQISADDEPAVYVSTILDSIADSKRAEAEDLDDVYILPALDENPTIDTIEEVVPQEQEETVPQIEEVPVPTETSARQEISTPPHTLTCLTVQPNRVLCGEQETLFIILTQRVDSESVPEVEFSSGGRASKRVPGTVENEYTISVTAPDMPAGVVSLTMHTDHDSFSLTPVTYYTNMGEVSRCLENATDPVNFICQAFNLSSNATESVDSMLSESLKEKMPATSLQLFGIKQIEEENMAAYQRNEELPTLLHFAAKCGLKKLTTILLKCPGALQAYSVMNKYGDYPNTLAEKSGFSDLRQFIDEFVETASEDIMMKFSGCSEDIYESMLGIDPDCEEDLYEVMSAVDENPEEAMLRRFFQAKPHDNVVLDNDRYHRNEEEERNDQNDLDQIEEEDPYNICPEDIYDTVDPNTSYDPVIINRPPAPIPRSEAESESERSMTYISRVFSDKGTSQSKMMDMGYPAARPVVEAPTPVHDPYAGMKTPGQRQLISLQERVKVGEITVDEAVQEIKAWQFDHERRSSSIRYQQENLKKLRDSITRRHKEREKTGKELGRIIRATGNRTGHWSQQL